jgi:hypothetical protein
MDVVVADKIQFSRIAYHRSCLVGFAGSAALISRMSTASLAMRGIAF